MQPTPTAPRGAFRPVTLAALLLAVPCPAWPASMPSIAGDYVCRSDCHPSDAPPSIEVAGTTAICRNDLGGVFVGQLLGPTAVSCFRMTGTLAPDGATLTWSNGGVWQRRR